MRPGETAALMWSDVDFVRNEIHVHAARESGTGAIKPPQTPAGIRDIPIHAELLPKLHSAQGEPFSPVFPTQSGNRQNGDSLRRLWQGFRRALDIHMGARVYRNKIVESVVANDLTPYCLRHTFCTDLQRTGMPINVAKELMGHADIQTTANIYTHRDQNTLHGCMARLDGTAGERSAGGNRKKA